MTVTLADDSTIAAIADQIVRGGLPAPSTDIPDLFDLDHEDSAALIHGRSTWHHDKDTNLVMPIMAGAAEEIEQPLGSLTFNWSAVGAAPSKQSLLIPGRTLHRRLVLRIAGTWDQSVGAETQATEGNPVLWDSIQLNLDGRIVRPIKGAVLFEWNRIMQKGAGPKTDPTTGVASGKAFSTTLYLDFAAGDLQDEVMTDKSGNPRLERPKELTYIDLSNYANVQLEIQPGPFSRYVSGSTQANMTATVTVTTTEVYGPVRRPQKHYSLLPMQTADMTTTGTDRSLPLSPKQTSIRGLLLRVGTLSSAPIVTAITALANVGVRTRLIAGGLNFPKPKQAVGLYQSAVGFERNGIALTNGYVWIDFASDLRWRSMLNGNAYAALDLIYDAVGTASTNMEVYQVCLHQ